MLLIILEGRFPSASGNDFMLISHKKTGSKCPTPPHKSSLSTMETRLTFEFCGELPAPPPS